ALPGERKGVGAMERRRDWLGQPLYLGAAVCGAACAAFLARHLQRVFRARRELQALVAQVAGCEARVVVTGASCGVGLELSRQLLRHPSVSLLVGCRDRHKAEALFRRYPRAKVHRLDLLDPDSIQAFADEAHAFLAGGETGLRMLVNNAGVMRPPKTKGGDATWQTNFLGPFLLTELLNRFRKEQHRDPVRVVHVSSRLEKRSTLDFELLESVAKGEVGENAYADSKRALMLWTSVRAQSLAFKGGLFCFAATPGMVDTELGRYSMSPWLWPLTKPLRMVLLRHVSEGALAVAGGALKPQATNCFGRYMDGEVQLEDLVIERMGEKPLAAALVKWATQASALEQRAAGYERSSACGPAVAKAAPLCDRELCAPGAAARFSAPGRPRARRGRWQAAARRPRCTLLWKRLRRCLHCSTGTSLRSSCIRWSGTKRAAPRSEQRQGHKMADFPPELFTCPWQFDMPRVPAARSFCSEGAVAITPAQLLRRLRRNPTEPPVSTERAEDMIAAMSVELRALTSPVLDISLPEGGADPRLVLVGDLHGQLQDVLHIVEEHGPPSEEVVYVFNGDIVDRGRHAVEIWLLIIAFKLASPRSVYVLRGNHENDQMISRPFKMGGGFSEECLSKYNHSVLAAFQSMFKLLPLFAVIQEEIFVVPGARAFGSSEWSGGDMATPKNETSQMQEVATEYPRLLGVEVGSRLFEVLSEHLKQGLPDGWSMHVAEERSAAYFWNEVSGQSRWTHPDHEIFQGLERLHREATAAADPAAHLRRGWAAMDAEAKRAEAQWSGPQVTDEGLQYWFLASGESSWMDPSEEARRARKVRAALFGALLHESRSSSRSSQSLSSVEVQPEAQCKAARALIVAACRGHLQRLMLRDHGLSQRSVAARSLQGACRVHLGRLDMQTLWQETLAEGDRRRSAAGCIQRRWRGHKTRCWWHAEGSRLRAEKASALLRARNERRRVEEEALRALEAKRVKAALVIQRGWRLPSLKARQVSRVAGEEQGDQGPRWHEHNIEKHVEKQHEPKEKESREDLDPGFSQEDLAPGCSQESHKDEEQPANAQVEHKEPEEHEKHERKECTQSDNREDLVRGFSHKGSALDCSQEGQEDEKEQQADEELEHKEPEEHEKHERKECTQSDSRDDLVRGFSQKGLALDCSQEGQEDEEEQQADEELEHKEPEEHEEREKKECTQNDSQEDFVRGFSQEDLASDCLQEGHNDEKEQQADAELENKEPEAGERQERKEGMENGFQEDLVPGFVQEEPGHAPETEEDKEPKHGKPESNRFSDMERQADLALDFLHRWQKDEKEHLAEKQLKQKAKERDKIKWSEALAHHEDQSPDFGRDWNASLDAVLKDLLQSEPAKDAEKIFPDRVPGVAFEEKLRPRPTPAPRPKRQERPPVSAKSVLDASLLPNLDALKVEEIDDFAAAPLRPARSFKDFELESSISRAPSRHGGLFRNPRVSLESLRQLPLEAWHRNYPNPLSKEEVARGATWSEHEEILFDALWADPHEGLGSKRSERGKVAVMFGEDVTHRFLDQAGLSLCLPRSQIFEMGGKVLKSPVIHGEPEEELESHEEDVLGEDLKSESESVLGELGAGVLRPAWVAPPPLAPAGDLQGASFEDLILPGSALLPRVEPTQHAEPAEANLLTGAGFAVVVTPAQEEPGGVARTSWQGAATLRREMQQGAATLRRDMQQAFDIEEAEEFAFPSLQLEVDDLQSCMSGSDAEPGLSIETFQEVVVEEDEVWGVDQLVDQALLLGDEDEMPAADDTLREVQKGVSTYRMIRNFRNRIWSETFGYNKQEMLFAPFLKLQ
ncbi:unnamed protein product, partial [Effrenium voratum]